jgi:hypothetical protein
MRYEGIGVLRDCTEVGAGGTKRTMGTGLYLSVWMKARVASWARGEGVGDGSRGHAVISGRAVIAGVAGMGFAGFKGNGAETGGTEFGDFTGGGTAAEAAGASALHTGERSPPPIRLSARSFADMADKAHGSAVFMSL